MRETSEATTLSVDRRGRQRLRVRGAEGRASAAHAGLERARSASSTGRAAALSERAAVCALRLSLRRRVGQFARGHRVGRARQARRDQDAYETGDLRFGLEGETAGAASLFVDNIWDERAEPVPQQPLGRAARSRSTAPRTIGLQFGTSSDRALTILVATSVVRGSRQGESHGGVYLVDFDSRARGPACSTGTRWASTGRAAAGTAACAASRFDGETVYIAASDELFAYTPDFRPIGSWRNRYLKHCHEICRHERTLFLTSTGFDSILGFDLDRKSFSWGLQVAAHGDGIRRQAVRSRSLTTVPAPSNTLHLNNVHCERGRDAHQRPAHGRGAAVQRSRAAVAGSRSRSACTMRGRSATACCSTTREADVVRFVSRSRRARVPGAAILRRSSSRTSTRKTRGSRGRHSRAACASSTTTLSRAAPRLRRSRCIDLRPGARPRMATLTHDVRNAIHGLEVWPFAWLDGVTK